MRERHWGSAALVTAVAILLSGCAASAYPAFDREPTERDALPESSEFLATSVEDMKLDLSTIRYEASYEEVEIYLARTTNEMVCLIVAAEQDSVMSCSPQGGGMTTTGPAGTFELTPAPVQEKDGWTVISENIRVEN